MNSFISGFSLGLSLILAIGAQNAFVLRAGLLGRHVFAISLVCALSDALLIAAGVAGLGAVITSLPALENIMRWAGAVFLIWYAIRSFHTAFTLKDGLQAKGDVQSLQAAILTCLALTWLNPHVYIDTVLLLGIVSQNFDSKTLFASGAICASFCFFFALGYGARLLTPLFAKPLAWRILEFLIGMMMVIIAFMLIFA